MGGWNCKLKKPISLDIKATLDMGLNTADTLSNIVDDLSTNSSMADVIIHDLEVATGVVVDGVKEVGYFFFNGASWIIIGVIGVLVLCFVLYLIVTKPTPGMLEIKTTTLPPNPSAPFIPSLRREQGQCLYGSEHQQ